MTALSNNRSRILSFIAHETYGESYSSYSYCFEREPMPTLDFEHPMVSSTNSLLPRDL